MTTTDELEQRLLDAFGPEAAQRDLRAREASRFDEIKFPSPTDDDGCLFGVFSVLLPWRWAR